MPIRLLLIIVLAGAFHLAGTAHAVDYVPNPGFEDCTSSPTSWAPVASDLLTCDPANPHAGASSLDLGNAPGQGLARAQSACVPIPADSGLVDASFAYRTTSAAVLQVAYTVQTFSDAGCTTNHGVASLGAGFSFGAALVTDGQWQTLGPAGIGIDSSTHSVRFLASFQLDPATTAFVNFDDLVFGTSGGSSTTTTTTTLGGTSSTVGGSSTTSSTLPTFVGTGKAASECYLTLLGIQATSGIQSECVDGDPACDRDESADGVCTFRFQVCVAQALAGCQATSITSVKASPASLAIPVPPVPASAPTCGDLAEVTVPLKRQGQAAGRRVLNFVAKNSEKPKVDHDKLRLRCLPSA